MWGLHTSGFNTEDGHPLSIYSREPGKLKIAFGRLNIIVTGTRILFIDNDFLSVHLPSYISGKTNVGWEVEQILTAMSAHGSGGTFMMVPDTDAWRVSIKEPILYAASTPLIRSACSERCWPFSPITPMVRSTNMRSFSVDADPWRWVIRRVKRSCTPSTAIFLLVNDTMCTTGWSAPWRFLAQLTAVDGAVLVNDDLKVLAFGAKIKPLHARKSPETLLVSEPTTGSVPEEVSLAEFGGMRHQSAAQFVFDQRQGVAFVASQDGIMTMLTWDEGAGRVAAVRHIELTF